MHIAEVIGPAAAKPLSPEQARIRALQTRVDQARQALKAERDRQKRQRALQQLHSTA